MRNLQKKIFLSLNICIYSPGALASDLSTTECKKPYPLMCCLCCPFLQRRVDSRVSWWMEKWRWNKNVQRDSVLWKVWTFHDVLCYKAHRGSQDTDIYGHAGTKRTSLLLVNPVLNQCQCTPKINRDVFAVWHFLTHWLFLSRWL